MHNALNFSVPTIIMDKGEFVNKHVLYAMVDGKLPTVDMKAFYRTLFPTTGKQKLVMKMLDRGVESNSNVDEAWNKYKRRKDFI